MDMGHHVVSPFLLLVFCVGDLFRCEVLVVLLDGFVCDGKTSFFFLQEEGSEELSPRPESVLGVVVSFHPISRHWGGHTAVDTMPFLCWHIDCVRVASVFRECERVESYLDSLRHVQLCGFRREGKRRISPRPGISVKSKHR